MAYERLLAARKKTVGAKQTTKAIERGQARLVYVARNADRHVVDPILQLCAAKNIPVTQVDSMQALGRACGIEVGCATAAVTEE
jgi:large subunit ribosomal protein L7A